MSKLAGHLLQTTPLVLAASLAAQQGAHANPLPATVETNESPNSTSLETSEAAPAEDFTWEPSILAAEYDDAPAAAIAPPPPEPLPTYQPAVTDAAALQGEPAEAGAIATESVSSPPSVTEPTHLTPPAPSATSATSTPSLAVEHESVVEAASEESATSATPAPQPGMEDEFVVEEPIEAESMPSATSMPASAPSWPTADGLESEPETVDALPSDAPGMSLEPIATPDATITPTAADVTVTVDELELETAPIWATETPSEITVEVDSPTPTPAAAQSAPVTTPDTLAQQAVQAGVAAMTTMSDYGMLPREANTNTADLDELEWDGRNLAQFETEPTELSVGELLEQVNQYSTEDINGALGQNVPGATQFSDVSPADWAYGALDDLVRRYDCLVGYPDGTFRGNRALSRYEFAAGLNACIQQVERLIAETTADLATQADLEVIQRLVSEFQTEIAALNARVDNLEGRVSFLEDNQFSTTTKLDGEVVTATADLFSEPEAFDRNYDGVLDGNDRAFTGSETLLQYRVRLNLLTSFTGRDQLKTRLQARNAEPFTALDGELTFEGQFGYQGSGNDNDVELDELTYTFPVNDKLTVIVGATGLSADEMVDTLNPFDSSGGGAISKFGQYNPIYRFGEQDAGLGLTYLINDQFELNAGYTTNDAGNADIGIANGGYNFISQLTFRPNEMISVAAVYSHAYGDTRPRGSTGLGGGVGSRGAQLNNQNGRGVNVGQRPVSSNSYGLQALVDINPSLFVGGWVGYTSARVTDVGDADIWNYAAFAGVRDLGGEGNQLGVVVGMEPRLESTDAGIGEDDRSTGLHIEGFYRIRVNDNIEITPGVIWLTAPDHNSTNDDIVAGVIRTRFRF